MSYFVQAAGVMALAIGTGAATVTVINEDIPDMSVPDVQWQPGTELDGLTFSIAGTVAETGEIEEDDLVFRDGGFMSMGCEEYCEFGFSPYQTWQDGEVLHFTTTTVCPDAPHTVVWHGTVQGDEMSISASWTTRRWYWTQQINVTGGGRVEPPGTSGATG